MFLNFLCFHVKKKWIPCRQDCMCWDWYSSTTVVGWVLPYYRSSSYYCMLNRTVLVWSNSLISYGIFLKVCRSTVAFVPLRRAPYRYSIVLCYYCILYPFPPFVSPNWECPLSPLSYPTVFAPCPWNEVIIASSKKFVQPHHPPTDQPRPNKKKKNSKARFKIH